MALDASALAQKLHDLLVPNVDAKGNPTPVSDMTKSYAEGVIAVLKAAVVSNLPGTITGTTAPSAPLSNGAGIGGIMVCTPAPMLAKTQVGKPAPLTSAENTALATYLSTGLISFAAGKVTGQCTNSPTSPGPLAAGKASGGKIVGLTGAGAMAAVQAATGQTGPAMLGHYTAVIDYILANAEAAYATVAGVCPPGGGPLGAGAAAGGTIV